jgi:hypothetical protein
MFSVLTSKLFGAASVGLAIAFVAMLLLKNGEISSLNKRLAAADKTIAAQSVDILTLRGNQRGLEQGVAACNSSVDAYKGVVEKIAEAGRAALAEVQKGSTVLNNRIKAIDAMPANSCDDAAAILKAGVR